MSLMAVKEARCEYIALLACPEHRMEDGDVCKHCEASGFAVRTRGRLDDELRRSAAPAHTEEKGEG